MRTKISRAMTPDSQESFSPSHLGRTRKRRMKRPRMPTAQAGRKGRRSRSRSGRECRRARESRCRKPTAQWLSVTRAKAQKAQKTKAWARPGSGRSRMTFGLAEDFPDEVPDALADGEEMEAGVFFDLQDFVEDGAEAAPEGCGRGDDQRGEEQLLKGWGSARVGSEKCWGSARRVGSS
jgi:hypothetical protein